MNPAQVFPLSVFNTHSFQEHPQGLHEVNWWSNPICLRGCSHFVSKIKRQHTLKRTSLSLL